MKTFTHPDGRTANIYSEVGDSGALRYSDGEQCVGPILSLAAELARRGFLDDVAEDAARFRFLMAAMIIGSPEESAGQAASEVLTPADEPETNSPEGIALLIKTIDLARKTMKEQA